MSKICLICCVSWTDYTKRDSKNFVDDSSSGDVDSSVFVHESKQAAKIFNTFCEHLDVHVNKDEWNFMQEPLPFCPSCKEIVEYMFQLHNQLQCIQNELKCCVENVRLKIENSTEDPNCSLSVEERTTNFRSMLKSSAIENASTTSKAVAEEVTTRALRRKPNSQKIKYAEEEVLFDSDSEENKQNSSSADRKDDVTKISDDDFQQDDYNESGGVSGDDEDKPKHSGKRSKVETSETRKLQKPRQVITTSDGFTYGGHKFIQTDNGFQCCECVNKVFRRKGGVLVHIRQIHLGEVSRHICEVCGRACDSPFALRNHRSTHYDERNFFCGCGKAFKNEKNLKRHIVETHKLKGEMTLQMMQTLDNESSSEINNPSKEYNCESCGQGFKEKTALQNHLRSHEGAKYFTCFHCSTNFLQKENLKRHLRRRHHVKFGKN